MVLPADVERVLTSAGGNLVLHVVESELVFKLRD